MYILYELSTMQICGHRGYGLRPRQTTLLCFALLYLLMLLTATTGNNEQDVEARMENLGKLSGLR